MKAALVILLFTIFIGFCTWILDRFFSKRLRIYGDHASESKEEDDADDVACCGLHDVCEKDLLTPLTDEFEYYDDEELDAFKGRAPESYTAEEVEMFRDILLTLRPDDVAGWSRSIQLRGITLPEEIREELIMIVGEQRDEKQL